MEKLKITQEKDFEKLIAWNKAMDLTEDIYTMARRFPKTEIFGLTSQIKRASISVPNNISEGHGRRSDRSFVHFLNIAHGSLMEVRNQIIIAKRLKYIPDNMSIAMIAKTQEVGKIINGLIIYLKSQISKKKGSNTYYKIK